ncbi:MAG: replication initiator protein A [Acidobacteriaceae bacterium]|nr:replication initiator protein A [Acidobacteriaceae bacterium]
MKLSLQEKKRIARESSRAFGSLELAGDILHRTQPDLVVSRNEFRQAESITLIREKRDNRNQSICFASRPFVLCGLPVRRLPKGQLLYERRNGRFTLQVTGHPEFGVPFGQDRMVPIFLATMAVRQQSPVLRFKSAAQMLETFGMQKGGKEYRRLIAAFERIFGATIFFGTHEDRPAARVIRKGRFNFLREAKLWYSRDIETAVIGEEPQNEIVLSDEFFDEINAHRIPTDLEVVKLLISSPAALDLFMWLSYFSFTAKGEERIPLFGPGALTAQLGSVEYARPRKFRERLEHWLDSIRQLWPECRASIAPDGSALIIRNARAIVTGESRAAS